MLPTGYITTSDGFVPLSKTEKVELKQLRASGPKARLVHVRYGDPPPYRMRPEREWAEVRVCYDCAPPKPGSTPRAVAIAQAIVVFHPSGDSSRHLVNGPPIGVKDLLNDLVRCGERATNDELPLEKRHSSAARFVKIGGQLEMIGGMFLVHNCYHATATQATLQAIDAVLRQATETPPVQEQAHAPPPPPPPPPRPPRPPRPRHRPNRVGDPTGVAPSPEALVARRQLEVKHAQHEAAQRVAEQAAELAHKQAMAARRAARAAEKAVATKKAPAPATRKR